MLEPRESREDALSKLVMLRAVAIDLNLHVVAVCTHCDNGARETTTSELNASGGAARLQTPCNPRDELSRKLLNRRCWRELGQRHGMGGRL